MGSFSAVRPLAFSLLACMLFAACGQSGFSGAPSTMKAKATPGGDSSNGGTGGEGSQPGGGGTGQATDSISVKEDFKQLRASNTSGKPDYGVGVISLTATGMVAGQKILNIDRTGMSSDIRFFLCSARSQPTPTAVQNGTQLFEQTVDCFLIFKGMKNNPKVHRMYPGIARQARVGTQAAARSFEARSGLCIVPEGDADPCVEKEGRVVVKDIVGGKSIKDFGQEPIDFPADSAIESDLKSIPK
jgi:hypothetical protein